MSKIKIWCDARLIPNQGAQVGVVVRNAKEEAVGEGMFLNKKAHENLPAECYAVLKAMEVVQQNLRDITEVELVTSVKGFHKGPAPTSPSETYLWCAGQVAREVGCKVKFTAPAPKENVVDLMLSTWKGGQGYKKVKHK